MRILARCLLPILIFLAFVFCGCSTPEEEKTRHYERGMEYFKQNQFKEAVIEFKNVVQADPKYGPGHYQMALAYLNLGSVRDAFSELQKTVDVSPDNIDARLKLAQILMLAKKTDEVEKHLEIILSHEPSNVDALLLKGALLLHKGAVDEALGVMEEAERTAPEDYRVYLALAGAYSRKNEPSRVEFFLKKAVSVSGQGKSQTQSRLALASFYESVGHKEEAEEELRLIMGENPQETEPFLAMARFYMRNGRMDEAEQVLRKATEQFPRSALPLVVLAELLGTQGRIEEAVSSLENAAVLAPEDVNIKAMLAAFSYDQEKYDEAEALSGEVLKKVSNHPVALLVKAKLQIHKGDFEGAIAPLTEILQGRPESPEALYFRAMSFAGLGSLLKAEEDLLKFISIRPGFLKARFMLAEVALRERKAQLTREQADFILKRIPDDSKALSLRAAANMLEGKWKDAEGDLERAVRASPDAVSPRYLLGRTYMAQKEFEKARKAFDAVLSADPGHIPSLTSVVAIYVYEKDLDGAIAFCEKLREKQPDNPAILVVEGRVLQQAERLDEAETVFKRAMELNPDLIAPYVSLAGIYVATDKAEAAIAEYKRLIERNPDLVMAHMAVGTLEEKLGRIEEAEDSYKTALRIKSDFAPAANNLAWLLSEKVGDVEQAFIYAQKAKAAAPGQPAILDTVGWVLVKRGSFDLAVSNFEEALKIWPDHPTIHYHMAVALKGAKDFAAAREELEKALDSPEDFPEAEDARRLLNELS
jgi:tetratricopeptide (TPR) repeat protein